jgi:hypothetical protein
MKNLTIATLKENIHSLETTLNLLNLSENDYSYKLLISDLDKLKSELSSFNNNFLSSKKLALISIQNLMLKFSISFDKEADINCWEIINDKIAKFELDYAEKNYYGIGSISIPSDIDKISYDYCVLTFKDVLLEVEKQIATYNN